MHKSLRETQNYIDRLHQIIAELRAENADLRDRVEMNLALDDFHIDKTRELPVIKKAEGGEPSAYKF